LKELLKQDSAKSKGDYISLNRNFRGQFLTDQIGDNVFGFEDQKAGAAANTVAPFHHETVEEVENEQQSSSHKS